MAGSITKIVLRAPLSIRDRTSFPMYFFFPALQAWGGTKKKKSIKNQYEEMKTLEQKLNPLPTVQKVQGELGVGGEGSYAVGGEDRKTVGAEGSKTVGAEVSNTVGGEWDLFHDLGAKGGEGTNNDGEKNPFHEGGVKGEEDKNSHDKSGENKNSHDMHELGAKDGAPESFYGSEKDLLREKGGNGGDFTTVANFLGDEKRDATLDKKSEELLQNWTSEKPSREKMPANTEERINQICKKKLEDATAEDYKKVDEHKKVVDDLFKELLDEVQSSFLEVGSSNVDYPLVKVTAEEDPCEESEYATCVEYYYYFD